MKQLGYLSTNSCPALIKCHSWEHYLAGRPWETVKCSLAVEKELRPRDRRVWSKKGREFMGNAMKLQVPVGWWDEGRTLICMECNYNIKGVTAYNRACLFKHIHWPGFSWGDSSSWSGNTIKLIWTKMLLESGTTDAYVTLHQSTSLCLSFWVAFNWLDAGPFDD